MLKRFVPEEIDFKATVICLTVAFCLTFINFIKIQTDTQLEHLIIWASKCFVFYFVVPSLVMKWILGDHWQDYGFKLKGSLKSWQLYLAMFLFMLPVIYICSQTPNFREHYPFYRIQPWESLYPNLFIWEFFYFLQFLGLEFFFRGFMVHGLKKRFGIHSILFMLIPYCMIHFGKPFPECIGSIFAGLILGYLSFRNNSVMLGVAIHYAVALSMDLLALS